MADLEQKLQDQPTWNPDTESIDESIDEDIEPSSSKQPKALVQTRKKKRRVTKAKPTKRIGNLVERLEQWAVENMKRKVALSHDIYSKQSHELEKQIATQHRLQRKVMEPPATPCLPALFLPNKGLVYNPRATNRWHPNGSNQRRVTQAPSIFKLPELRRLTAAPPVENRQATLATHNMSDRVMTMDRSD